MDPDTVNRLRQWLIAEMGFYHGYHNHKETMAWLATAFYIPGIVVSGYSLGCHFQWPASWFRLVYFIPILFAGVIIWLFLRMQFDRREYANHAILGLRRVLVELESGDLKTFCFRFEKNEEWPQSIREAISLVKLQREIGKYARCSKYLTYAAIFLATIVALAFVGASLCS